MVDDLEQRIKARAYAIWEREGRPEGRDGDHWTLAKEEIAIEDNLDSTLLPNPARGPDDTAAHPEPVEPALAMAALGDLPGLEDQGKQTQVPRSRGGEETPPAAEALRPPPAAPARQRPRRNKAG